MDTKEIIYKIQKKEENAKRRAIFLTFIPLLAAIILVTFTTIYVYQAAKELNDIKSEVEKTQKENLKLKMQNDSLINVIKESTITLGQTASVLAQFKNFIDEINPPERNFEEAEFYIKFRMFEEKVRGDYYYLSEKISKLPNITDDRIWVVIVASSVSLEDLKMEAETFQNIFGKSQIAIYKTKTYYALVVKGNGTFTRAYRLNIELIKKYGNNGAYFSGSKDWGKDYLL